jgi:hypothetical protein
MRRRPVRWEVTTPALARLGELGEDAVQRAGSARAVAHTSGSQTRSYEQSAAWGRPDSGTLRELVRAVT